MAEMCPNSYYNNMRLVKDKKTYRRKLVLFAEAAGVKPAARAFGTTPKTVRKWLARWRRRGQGGLDDRRGHPGVSRIPDAERKKAIQLKKAMRSFGAERLRRDYGLRLSEKAVRKVWREAGLSRKKRRKHRTKQDLREMKKAWGLFGQVCADTKDLKDIPEYWTSMRRIGLPSWQYTAREVVSGLHFVAFAHERSLANSTLFAQLLIAHLKRHGAHLSACRIQTDNGSEFIGSWHARRESAFTRAVEAAGLTHQTIPPGAHTWQADVETAHRLIEDEFYEVETFRSTNDFLRRAAAYSLWFNAARKNRYKGDKTPLTIARQWRPAISPNIAFFPPVILDDLLAGLHTLRDNGGYLQGQYPLKTRIYRFRALGGIKTRRMTGLPRRYRAGARWGGLCGRTRRRPK